MDTHKPGLRHSQISEEIIEQVERQLAEPPSLWLNLTGAQILEEEGQDTKDIVLPNNRSQVTHIAVDIGGSLAKILYYVRDTTSPSSSSSEINEKETDHGGRLSFAKFETSKIDDCINLMRQLIQDHARESRRKPVTVMATGGGAYKFYDRMSKELNVEVIREDEMECLITGLDYLVSCIPGEVFMLNPETCEMTFQEQFHDGKYPHMLVNIGSGVSILKVTGPSKFERIGGSSLGGGTLWGLLSLLTHASSFDEMLELSKKGDNAAVDMLVGDIYGENIGYERIGLKDSTIASSFGKVFRENKKLDEFLPEDIARSLLLAISNNIGQIAYLHAQKHNVKNIYFGGSFIRNHVQTMHTLTYAIQFWSNQTMNAYFLRHEGYLGVFGAFLKYARTENNVPVPPIS
ncbi:fumble family pantothenate kinase [Schizosaccharomyces octosporus yFS286]|uniref:pantothenate kinase n=1 Tax=Schizosaccharomyces octosporus (strain yFS286) TaxID=483514 RepID=S9QZF2_SCHOY|nr:fumble family pantothenate kinase [Schizosaccharomyces octosporus yFS286]EPX71610.1 fumble family pantothenate kinase [Schizosaccharomyces octosporus yFS286]